MKTGIALDNTVVGLNDFLGDKENCTLYRGGPAEMIDVWKCPKCGHSIYKR